MTSLRVALLAAGLVAAGTALFGPAPALAKLHSCTDPVTFGTTISSSGQFAALAGTWAKMTVEFAKMINDRGGIYLRDCHKKLPLQIIIYDDQSEPASAARLYVKLATTDRVDFFVGPDWSSVGAKVAPVARRFGIPIVMANVTDPAIFRRGGNDVWATPVPTIENWSTRYFDMLAQQTPKPKTIYFITQDNPVTQRITDVWRKRVERQGYNVIGDETFAAGREDFTSMLLRVRLHRPDVIYISSFDDPSVPLIRQMRRLDIRAGDVHHALLSAALERKVGSALDGTTGDLAWYPGVKGAHSDFAAELLKRSGIDMFEHPWTMSRIAAYLVMVDAVERAGSVDRDKVRAALTGGRFDVPFGVVAFDERGYPRDDSAVTVQMQHGKPVVVWPPEVASGPYVYPAPDWNRAAKR